MKDSVSNGIPVTPMLFPFEPELYWQQVRQIVREEVNSLIRQKNSAAPFDTPGLAYKPLFKISEVCSLFQVTKPTIYDLRRCWCFSPATSM